MKVFGNRVLVEQIVVTKTSDIVLPGGKKAESQQSASFKVLDIGKKVREEGEIQIGDIPIFGKHVVFHGVKVVKNDKVGNIATEILHVIVYDEDILGADDAPVQEVIEKESETKIEE